MFSLVWIICVFRLVVILFRCYLYPTCKRCGAVREFIVAIFAQTHSVCAYLYMMMDKKKIDYHITIWSGIHFSSVDFSTIFLQLFHGVCCLLETRIGVLFRNDSEYELLRAKKWMEFHWKWLANKYFQQIILSGLFCFYFFHIVELF